MTLGNPAKTAAQIYIKIHQKILNGEGDSDPHPALLTDLDMPSRWAVTLILAVSDCTCFAP